MKKFMLILPLFIVSCAGGHWSFTPYASTGRTEEVGRDWRAGVSWTFYDKAPAYPAVPNSYYSKVVVNGGSSSSSSSESVVDVDHGKHKHHSHGHHKHGDCDDD